MGKGLNCKIIYPQEFGGKPVDNPLKKKKKKDFVAFCREKVENVEKCKIL